jgi:CRP-like cAMP-binding protein
METLDPILAKHPFFKDMDERYRALLVGCASNVRFEEGEYLMREGAEAEKFYLIRHGVVAVEVFIPGQGPMTIETLREGDLLGWSWLVPPYRCRFDSRAMEQTRAIAMDGLCLRNKCEENPELGFVLLKRFAAVIAHRLQATRLQLMDMYGPKKKGKGKGAGHA